jgi:hypothetical protein
MTKKESEKKEMEDRVQFPCLYPIFYWNWREKRKAEINESTNVVDKRKKEKQLVLASIFCCYVFAVLFVEFMVVQGLSRLQLLLYWSQLASDCQLIYCQLRNCREQVTWSTVAQRVTTGEYDDGILFLFAWKWILLIYPTLIKFKNSDRISN